MKTGGKGKKGKRRKEEREKRGKEEKGEKEKRGKREKYILICNTYVVASQHCLRVKAKFSKPLRK